MTQATGNGICTNGHVVAASQSFCGQCGAQRVDGPVVIVQQPPSTTTNGLAIASMVLGIVWVYWIGSILALIFGYVARRRIKKSGGSQTGNGMAIAGIVLGWVGIGFLIFVIILAITSSSNSGA